MDQKALIMVCCPNTVNQARIWDNVCLQLTYVYAHTITGAKLDNEDKIQ
jgi:hypothetical protein